VEETEAVEAARTEAEAEVAEVVEGGTEMVEVVGMEEAL
jgi:hypothetical protein